MPGSAAFLRQVEAHAIGIACVLPCRLQDAEVGLHPVVGRQALGDQGRQQQIAFSEPLDDRGFHAGTSWVGWVGRHLSTFG